MKIRDILIQPAEETITYDEYGMPHFIAFPGSKKVQVWIDPPCPEFHLGQLFSLPGGGIMRCAGIILEHGGKRNIVRLEGMILDEAEVNAAALEIAITLSEQTQ